MTEKDKLFAAIDKATNPELAQIYKSVAGFDPFTKYKMDLPSEVRTRTIAKIKEMIDKGEFVVTKAKG
jgi:predicted secreted protein